MSHCSAYTSSTKIQTVLGTIDGDDLGRTLTHEHLTMEFSHFYRKPPIHLKSLLAEDSIHLENVGSLRQYPYSSLYNLTLNDMESKKVILEEVKEFKRRGGGAIVENSTEGLNKHWDFLKTVSIETGIHVVAGTGFYIADMQSDSWVHATVEELADHMEAELTIGNPLERNIKAGFIGELGSVWPLRDFEKKVIKAAAIVQKKLGCGVSFHPHRDPEAPFEIMRLFLQNGGRADKTVMSHLDRTFVDDEKLMEFAKLGTYCQYDLFGTEVSYYQLNVNVDMPSDAQRLDKIQLLVNEGYTNRILMSHDIHTKHRLTKFGGHGYTHILDNILPRMKTRGFTKETIDKITIHNPVKWLKIEEY